MVATRRFSKVDIVCNYNGKVITAAAGRAMMQEIHDEAGYLFFFKARQRDLCIDAQTSPVNATQTQTRLAEGSTILLKGPT